MIYLKDYFWKTVAERLAMKREVVRGIYLKNLWNYLINYHRGNKKLVIKDYKLIRKERI